MDLEDEGNPDIELVTEPTSEPVFERQEVVLVQQPDGSELTLVP